MKRILFLIVFVLALWLPIACSGGGDDGSPQLSLKVGIVQSQSGAAASYGTSATRGIELAIKHLESDRLRIETRLVDDRSTAEGGVSAFTALAQEQVHAIIGPTLSGVAQEAFKVSQARGVLAIGATTTGIGITSAGDQIYRTALPESEVVPPVLAYVNSRSPIRQAALFLDSSDAFSVASAAAMKTGVQAISARVIQEIDVAGRTDFAAILAPLQGQEIDAFLVTPLIGQAGPLVKALRDAGFRQPLIGGNSFNTLDMVAASGGAVEGAYVGAAWNPGLDNAASRRFVDEYTKAYGTPPDLYAAQGYAAVEVLVAAAQRAGSVDNGALRAALNGIRDLETVFGKLSMTSSREASFQPVVQQFQNGKLVVVR